MGPTGPLPPPGWYPDPAGTPGKSYWDGQHWGSPPSKPLVGRNKITLAGIAAFVLLLVLLSNCHGGGDNRSSRSTTSTVTATITAAAPPSTVTVTVTASAEAPASPVWTVPPQTTTEAPPAVPVPLIPSAPASVYYPNCAAARAAGAAPLYIGEPGYRPGLDRDGDGIACE